MIGQQRAKLEEKILSIYIPKNMFRFCNIDTSSPYLQIAVQANDGATYLLYFDLSKFPASEPKVYVQQMLHTYSGQPMDKMSYENYTHISWNGWTQLWHIEDYHWYPDITLWKVYVVCCIWIEAYRNHLRTGKPINHYLDYQDSLINLDKAFQNGKQLFTPIRQQLSADADTSEDSVSANDKAPNNPPQ